LLLVDDNPAICMVLAAALHRAGFEVDVAGDSRAALALARGAAWAGAVLDVDLPDGNGIDLLEQLRARLGEADFPALFITGRLDPFRAKRIDRLGATRVLPKPFGCEALHRAVTALLQARCA
jgi:DNA-binding response OmpR family regulator